ncbi:hypothetical protein DYB26_009278 [Aphanomyces astaci]|uniref:Uncharacterized protein n=1 Tax=Aphanomyces astaci TaxID=112090 RepID=A0A3R7AV44_APHAT|nr:hypothetical protein DYB26_009278 [Aphanomyces astaci]
MQQTEVLTESASLRMPPTFTDRDTTPLPLVPTAAPMSQPNRDADSYPSSGAYGQLLGVGYTQPSLRDTGSGYASLSSYGVVTQVERILPHLLEVDRMGVTMVDPSGAEVTLRDLLVVENPDMMDPAGTTVGLLALREADPEEMALVPGSPTHPWSPIRIHVVRIFDDRLTSCGDFIQKTLSRKMAEITDNSHRKSTETFREYAWWIADASREAGLQANRTVVMMINGCSDAEVAACLRGASVRPETIEISLDYLIERDVDIDRRTDGSRSPPPDDTGCSVDAD